MILGLSIAYLVYVWGGYLLLLWLLNFLPNKRDEIPALNLHPRITVIVAAHNEAMVIGQRIKNLFDTNYPLDKITVLVASDGSSDDTIAVARAQNKKPGTVTAVEVIPQAGRAGAHNFSVAHLRATDNLEELLIFTDANTQFDRNTLTELVQPFGDPEIGYVAGRLAYSNQHASDITQSAGFYWKFEQSLRRLETDLGLFAFGTGAVCAVRSELYRDIPPTGDVDFTTPLDVILQGYSCVQSQTAKALDEMPGSPKQEFRARVRMTSKNLFGTLTRWGVAGHFKHPLYTWVIWSHKIGRWMTPFAMFAIFLGSLLSPPSNFILAFLACQVGFYALGLLHGLSGLGGRLGGAIFSFLLANAGFFVGVIKVLTGDIPSSYLPTSQPLVKK